MNNMNMGLDPEVLALSNGYIVPAEHFVPAPTRDTQGILNPLSWDNAAVEMRPHHSAIPRQLAASTSLLMRRTKMRLKSAIESGSVPPDTKLSFIPASHLTDDGMKLRSVKKFGCSPSQVVTPDYSSVTTVPTLSASDTSIRTAGFHIHHELEDTSIPQAAVAVLDGLLGLTDVLVNHSRGWSAPSKARRLTLGYGTAGEHRVRTVPTGATVLEYRTMSPWPLASLPSMVWATKVMRDVCEMELRPLMTVLSKFPERSEIVEAINTSDNIHATKLLLNTSMVWGKAFSAHSIIRQTRRYIR